MLSPHESLNLNTARGLLAAVSGNPATYPGWSRSTTCTRTAATRCCSSPSRWPASATRAGSPRTAGRSTRPAPRRVDHRDRREPTRKDPHVALAGQRPVARHVAQRRRQPRLRRRPDRARHADPRHVARSRRASPTRRCARSAASPGAGVDPAERDPVHARAAIPTCSSSTSTTPPRWARAAPTTSGAGADHRHRRRDPPARRSPNLRCRSTSPPTTRPPSGDPGATSPVPGLRGALLQHPDARRPEDRRLLVHRLRAAAVRHQRPRAPEGDRLLRRADARPSAENDGQASDFAMSQPAFVPERHEVWFTDGTSGFYVLRVADDVWPGSAPAPAPACAGARLRTAHVTCPAAPTSARSRRSSGASACARRATAAR